MQSSITTNFKQYGSHKTVEPFDLPTQNTIIVLKGSLESEKDALAQFF